MFCRLISTIAWNSATTTIGHAHASEWNARAQKATYKPIKDSHLAISSTLCRFWYLIRKIYFKYAPQALPYRNQSGSSSIHAKIKQFANNHPRGGMHRRTNVVRLFPWLRSKIAKTKNGKPSFPHWRRQPAIVVVVAARSFGLTDQSHQPNREPIT